MTPSAQLLLAEISGNSYILLGVMIAMVFAVSYGLYTRRGSGINKHPVGDSSDPVLGDQTKSAEEDVGDDDEEHEDEHAGIDQSEGSAMDQRGTK